MHRDTHAQEMLAIACQQRDTYRRAFEHMEASRNKALAEVARLRKLALDMNDGWAERGKRDIEEMLAEQVALEDRAMRAEREVERLEGLRAMICSPVVEVERLTRQPSLRERFLFVLALPQAVARAFGNCAGDIGDEAWQVVAEWEDGDDE